MTVPHQRPPAAESDIPRLPAAVRRFPPTPASVAAARRFVARLLSTGDPDLRERAVLIVSELATNALRHAGGGFTVELGADGVITYLAVHDESPSLPRPRTPAPTETGGRGLQIVSAVADDWGVATRGEGKTVWCRLNAAGPTTARPTQA